MRGRVAGYAGSYPLQVAENADKLVEIIRHFSLLFFCAVAALTIMGNHYHPACLFEPFRKLTMEELRALAERFHRRARRPPAYT